MTRAYRDPTADQAVSHADKWERMQAALEAKHGVHRGDKIAILDRRTSDGDASTGSCTSGCSNLVKINVTVVALYPYFVHLHTEFGYDTCLLWRDFEQVKTTRREKGNKKHGQKKKQ